MDKLKDLPKGVIIGLIALLVLCAIGIGWKTLAGSNPAPEKMTEATLKPDVPAGTDRGKKGAGDNTTAPP